MVELEGRGSTRDLEEPVRDSVIDGRYTVKRYIARGGVASVFEAEHVTTGAAIALKTLHRPALDQVAAHQRLLREARVIGALRHPNIVGIHDAGYCLRHGSYLALEMIEGRPLDGILSARRALPIAQAIAVLVEVCGALECLHQRGMVHRDLKPSNLLVLPGTSCDRIKLIDFGVAKVGPELESRSEKLTRSGELLGTVEYMSPEQLIESASEVDARSDVYALGVILYECLTGEVPLSGTATAVIAQMVACTPSAPILLKRPEAPPALEAAVRRALELDRSRRFGSASELRDACVDAVGQIAPLDLLELVDDRARSSDAESVQRRRRFVRAPYVTPVRLVLQEGVVDGRTADISEGGALIFGDVQCAADQAVKVRLPMPTSGRVMTIDAVTRWVRSHRNQRSIGIEFDQLSDSVREDIATYVRLMSSARVGS